VTTIYELATKIFPLVASWRPNENVNFEPCKTKPVGENKEVNKIHSRCVSLTSLYLKNYKNQVGNYSEMDSKSRKRKQGRKNFPKYRKKCLFWPVHKKTQSLGIHDVLNVQGFTRHYRVITNTVNPLEVFWCEWIPNSKAKGWIDLFSYAECFRSKDLSICISGRT